MKPIRLLMSIILFLSASLVADAAKPCECGSHSTGITTYTVGTGQGCCSGTAGSGGVRYTYTEDEGVWTVSGTEPVSGNTAQNDCCPPASPPDNSGYGGGDPQPAP